MPRSSPPTKNSENASIFAMNRIGIPSRNSMTGGSFQFTWFDTRMYGPRRGTFDAPTRRIGYRIRPTARTG